MISVYIEKMMPKMQPTSKPSCARFSDLNQVNAELQSYIVQSCELGLMGYFSDGETIKPDFSPNDTITHAEVATLLSRMLRGNTYKGTEQYRYHNHLLILQKIKVLPSGSDPMHNETRGGVIEALRRISSTISSRL